MERPVTEKDLRMPEFADANVDDLEFRRDGKIVQKDRWEKGIRSIAAEFGLRNFEVEDVVDKVVMLIHKESDK